ncbi:MAG: hypothetical protein AAB769_00790 [Patescibacteria group bacterium]
MTYFHNNKQGGFIKLILIVIAVIIALSYFGFNLRAIVEAPATQDNLGYAWGLVTGIWSNYLSVPFEYLWGIFVQFLWEPLVGNLQHIKDAQPAVPNVTP